MILIREIGIFSPFLDLVRSFRARVDETGENSIGCHFRALQDQTGRADRVNLHPLLTLSEICFDLRYPAIHGRNDCSPIWSIRRTGIYHKYKPETEKSTWILIQPSESIKNRTETLARQNDEFSLLLAPFLLVLFSTERKWGEYIEYLEDRFKQIVSDYSLPEFYE